MARALYVSVDGGKGNGKQVKYHGKPWSCPLRIKPGEALVVDRNADGDIRIVLKKLGKGASNYEELNHLRDPDSCSPGRLANRKRRYAYADG